MDRLLSVRAPADDMGYNLVESGSSNRATEPLLRVRVGRVCSPYSGKMVAGQTEPAGPAKPDADMEWEAIHALHPQDGIWADRVSRITARRENEREISIIQFP